MSILTGRELNFLSNLQKSWKGLYLSEVMRLLAEDDCPCVAPLNAHSTDRQCRPLYVFTLKLGWVNSREQGIKPRSKIEWIKM
jgi:hypothetical protein